MRKIFGRILLALGGFLLVLGVLTTVWAPGAVKKTPIDVDSTTYLSGEATKLGETFPVQVTSVTQSDTDASTEETAVWKNTSCVMNASVQPVPDCADNEQLVSANVDFFATDRVTGLAVESDEIPEGYGPHEGLVNKFPFDTELTPYQYWDGTAGSAVPLSPVGETDLNGLDVYEFTYTVTDEPIEIAEDVNGTYSNEVHIFVEPRTGAIVNQTQHQQRYLANEDGSRGDQVLDLQAEFTEDQIEKSVADAEEKAGKLDLMTRTLPLVGFIGGAVALLAGLLLLRGTRSGSPAGASSREHAAV